jgi:hypothetical protein
MLAFLNIFSELKNARVLKLFSIFKPKCVTQSFTHFVQHTSALEILRLEMNYGATELLALTMLVFLNIFSELKNARVLKLHICYF